MSSFQKPWTNEEKMHGFSFLFIPRPTVNPKLCGTPAYAGFTVRFSDTYCTGMMFPDKYISCRCVALFSQRFPEGL